MYNAPIESRGGRTPDQEHRFSYKRRIRGKMYVWGSKGTTSDAHFDSSLILYLRNDTFGESIAIHTEQADGTIKDDYGTLDAGEYLSIPIQDISRVAVTCALESTVSYMLSGDPGGQRLVTVESDHMLSNPNPNSF
jgi:hypothetical protein